MKYSAIPGLLTAALALVIVAAADSAVAGEPGTRVTVEVGSLSPEEGGAADAPASPLDNPFGLAFDSAGAMYIAEYEGGRIWRRPRDGKLEIIAGSRGEGYAGDGGPARDATFRRIHNVVATPEGHLFISDTSNQCVRRVDGGSGVITTWAGNGRPGFAGDGGPATQASFHELISVALDPACSTLYLADLTNRRIRAIDLQTQTVRTVAGNGKKGVPRDGAIATDSPLVDPRGVAADSQGQVYILERGGNALRVVRSDGSIYTVAGTGAVGTHDGPGAQAAFKGPKHLCIDDQDRVIIADAENHLIRRFDPASGMVSTILGNGQGTPVVKLNRPHGVCVYQGALYVADSYNNRILRVDGLE